MLTNLPAGTAWWQSSSGTLVSRYGVAGVFSTYGGFLAELILTVSQEGLQTGMPVDCACAAILAYAYPRAEPFSEE